jgi:hypothetical protein
MLNNARRVQPPFAKAPLPAIGKKNLLRQRQPRDSRTVRTVFQTIVGKDPRSLHAAKLYAAVATYIVFLDSNSPHRPGIFALAAPRLFCALLRLFCVSFRILSGPGVEI